MNNAESIARWLGNAKKTGEGWMCKCPLHDDKVNSLKVTESDNKILFHCFAGCEGKDILNYARKEGMITELKSELPKIRKEICRYQYINVDGELLFEKIRFESKEFQIVNPYGLGDGGHKGAIYNAQNLKDAKGKIIYIVEGEKDVDTITSIGLLACTSGGASNWPKANNYLFDGCHVRIIPDNDEPGKKYAQKVRESLESIAESLKVMFIPDRYKDVSDWVYAGATKNDIEELFNQHKFKTISFSKLLELDMEPNWLIQDYVGSNEICQFFGASGSGKSFFALDAAYCVAAGIDFFGKKVKKSNVLYIAGEGFNGLKKRAMALKNKYGGGDIGCLEFSLQAAELMSESSCIDVSDRIKNNPGKFGLVIIDTLNRNMGGGDENSTKDMTLFITNIDKHIRSLGCSIIIIHHSGLMNGDRARGSGAMYNAIDSEFKISKDKSNVMNIKCTKQKEGESDWEKSLVLVPVVVGYDHERDAVYSCIIKDSDASLIKLEGRNDSVFCALRQLSEENGIEREINGLKVFLVNDDEWREYSYKRLDGKNKRRDFCEAKKYLQQNGYVLTENGLFYTLNL